MKWIPITAAVLMLLAAGAAEAWRVGNQLVVEGDTVAEVLEVAGRPDYRETLVNDRGAAVGYRWYYREPGYNNRTVIVTILGSRVTDISIERH